MPDSLSGFVQQAVCRIECAQSRKGKHCEPLLVLYSDPIDDESLYSDVAILDKSLESLGVEFDSLPPLLHPNFTLQTVY